MTSSRDAEQGLHGQPDTSGVGVTPLTPPHDPIIEHRMLWRTPAELIQRRKLELQARGEPIVERLTDPVPVPLRLSYPVSLDGVDPEILAQLGVDLSGRGIPILEVQRTSMFQMTPYGDKTTGEEHVAVLKGEGVGDGEGVPIRIHSSCVTAETFGASNCDCREQLNSSLTMAQKEGRGGVIWLHQEGRGNGLAAKALQLNLMINHGMNTVEAYEALGLPSEQRDFTAAADMLRDLGVKSVRLITNNPDKIGQMEAAGIKVIEAIPIQIPPANEIVLRDLRAKRDSHGHKFPQEM